MLMNEVVVKKQSSLGRPRTIDEQTVRELVEAFKHGYSVSIACNKVGIARSTYYEELARNEAFSDKVQAAQDVLDHIAITQVYHRMSQGDWRVSMWWLDRRDRQANNAQRVAEYRDQKKLLVTETHTETNGMRTTLEPDSQHPPKVQEYSDSQHERTIKLEKQVTI
jgi:hypothetical protein